MLHDAAEALDFLASQNCTVKGTVNALPAGSVNDSGIYLQSGAESYIIPTLRQQIDDKGKPRISLCDYINPMRDSDTDDYVGLFAVSTGTRMQQIIDEIAAADEYKGLVYSTVADRLAEAATEATHRQALHDWHYAASVNLTDLDAPVDSIRPAIGYPSLPDQSLIFILDKILGFSKVDMQPTESGALNPPASTAGLIILNPEAATSSSAKSAPTSATATSPTILSTYPTNPASSRYRTALIATSEPAIHALYGRDTMRPPVNEVILMRTRYIASQQF